MFTLAGDQNAKQRYENDKTGYRLATSVGGTATGEGGSRLLLDDPHSAQEAQSDAFREAAVEWFDMVWSTSITCLLYTSPSPRDRTRSRMPSSA